METRKLELLGELLEEYRAGCAADGLLNFARKVASVRNCVASDAAGRRRQAVIPITEGRLEPDAFAVASARASEPGHRHQRCSAAPMPLART
jgi:hypothetical protein